MFLYILYHGITILKTLRHSLPERTHSGPVQLLVLVPHRDARLPLRNWSGALFTAGIYGAWSFPQVAPLAIAAEPFTRETLKSLACVLREQSLAGDSNGKINAGGAAVISAFPGNALPGAAIFGPALNIALPADLAPQIAENILYRFAAPVLGCALLRNDKLPPALPAPPVFSFRAAALANMRYRPLAAGRDLYSFAWNIGALHWLPSVHR